MLKSLILFTLLLNISFAKDRFSEADKKKFLDDVKQEIAEHKVENKGRVDLQIIKPGLYAELEEALKLEKFTRDEMNAIKQNYEAFSKDPSISPDKAEEAFYAFMQKELDNINKKPLHKVAEGSLCNNWGCEDGLKCAPDPLQFTANFDMKGKKGGVACNENSECASQDCILESANSKKKVCEEVYKCFKPLKIGEACSVNPVCGAGQCLPFMSMTSGIGECEVSGKTCKKNSDCCSNSCSGGQCKDNFICKDCVNKGSKPSRGQKCCEGLYLNEKGICTPDTPPSVIMEVRVSPIKSFLISLANIFISTADAGEISKIQAQFDAMLEANADAPIGSTFMWGSGKFTVLPTGNLKFTGSSGNSVELTEKSNIVKVANASPELRKSFVENYGVDPLGMDRDQQASNASTIRNFEEIEKAKTRTSTETSTSAEIPGYGKVTYTFAHTEGSGENAVNVPASITSAYGTVYSPASDFYASNEYAAMTGKKMTAEDYKFLEDEKKAATKTAQSGATDGSAAAALEDEETFLNLGAENDGLDLKTGVMANKDKKKVDPVYEKLNMEKDKAQLNFAKKSNFATCEMSFKDDFYNMLKANVVDEQTKRNAFDLEVAMLGFDFVITGDSDSDYWKSGSVAAASGITVSGVNAGQEALLAKLAAEQAKNASAGNSIFNRLKAVGLAHRQSRIKTNIQIDIINKKLTCACLDVQGYNKIVNDEKKKFFETSCDEYAKYKNPETSLDELNGDASGLKAKRMLVIWTQNLQQFHASLAVDNNAFFNQLTLVRNYAYNEAKWNDAEARNYDLFKFTIKNPSGAVAGLGALIGALLAAGVIAIMGGFATTSILTAWAAAGIIAASAVTGAGGMWMIATLKGAWITMQPQISDGITMPRTYSCGKKESCTDYTRTLVQPYNNICNKHTSANACIKSFIIVNEGKEARYIVDPWIPVGVSKAAILKGQPNYVEKLEEGFNAAKNAMIMKNPGATGGGGKKGGGNFVSESYLAEVFIDADIVGKYAPGIGNNMQENYFLGQDRVKIIKEAAKEFAINEGFLEKGDDENLKEFADYAYEYHFLWPKKSIPGQVSYPTAGLQNYLDFMAGTVSGNLTAGLAKGAIKLAKLQEQYQKDYNNTYDLYDKTLNHVDGLKKALLTTEINKNKEALANLMNFNSLLDSKNLDQQLQALNSNASGSTLSGSSAGGLSNGQSNFLKAVSNLRGARKAQLKSLDTYNKAMAASGDKDRMAKVASATKKFSSNFASGNSSFADAKIGSNSSPLDSNSSKDDQNKSGAAVYGAIGGSNSGMSGTGSLFGAGSGSSNSKSSNSDSSGSEGAGGTSGVSDADASKLADAIDARNKSNKDKYQSNDGQSLFEKVTNAYIRNYDKVLTKKKDKDVVEEKQ